MPLPAASRALILLFGGLRPDLVMPEGMPAFSTFPGGAWRFTEAFRGARDLGQFWPLASVVLPPSTSSQRGTGAWQVSGVAGRLG
jgi:hypothetical protein